MNEQIHYASQILAQLAETLGRALPGIFAGLAVIVAFFIAAIMSRKLLRRLSARVQADKRPLVEPAGETVRYVVIAVGLISGLGTMGVDISALVAGLGLTGFALGFALRDAVSNLIAGVLILVYQPFGYGDKITVGGNSGTVLAPTSAIRSWRPMAEPSCTYPTAACSATYSSAANGRGALRR